MERGAENCGDLIEAHKECMRKMGFKIWFQSNFLKQTKKIKII